jgi:hypothetical protein
MERSKLENISNAQLFYLLKNVIKLLDGFRDGDIEHPGFSDDCESAATIVGLDLSFPIDENYIASTLKLNPDYDFDGQKPNGEIERPIAGLYSFDIDEHRIENVRRTYRHKVTSYDESLVIPTSIMSENEGYFEYFDGEEFDVDYYDGETTDVSYDYKSVRKINHE